MVAKQPGYQSCWLCYWEKLFNSVSSLRTWAVGQRIRASGNCVGRNFHSVSLTKHWSMVSSRTDTWRPHWTFCLKHRTAYGHVVKHRRSQDFVWGCTFCYQRSWRPFFSRRPQRTSKYTPPNLTRPAKTVLKIDSCSGWGCTSCPRGVHLHIFPVNYTWKFFFTALGVQVHPLHPWLRLCC